jgi:hypothetical protein
MQKKNGKQFEIKFHKVVVMLFVYRKLGDSFLMSNLSKNSALPALMLLNSCLQWGPLVESLLSGSLLFSQVHWPLAMNMQFLLNFNMINLPGF